MFPSLFSFSSKAIDEAFRLSKETPAARTQGKIAAAKENVAAFRVLLSATEMDSDVFSPVFVEIATKAASVMTPKEREAALYAVAERAVRNDAPAQIAWLSDVGFDFSALSRLSAEYIFAPSCFLDDAGFNSVRGDVSWSGIAARCLSFKTLDLLERLGVCDKERKILFAPLSVDCRFSSLLANHHPYLLALSQASPSNKSSAALLKKFLTGSPWVSDFENTPGVHAALANLLAYSPSAEIVSECSRIQIKFNDESLDKVADGEVFRMRCHEERRPALIKKWRGIIAAAEKDGRLEPSCFASLMLDKACDAMSESALRDYWSAKVALDIASWRDSDFRDIAAPSLDSLVKARESVQNALLEIPPEASTKAKGDLRKTSDDKCEAVSVARELLSFVSAKTEPELRERRSARI